MIGGDMTLKELKDQIDALLTENPELSDVNVAINPSMKDSFYDFKIVEGIFDQRDTAEILGYMSFVGIATRSAKDGEI
jgi:hypothetical protein